MSDLRNDPRNDPDAPARYEVDGKVYYRASALGMCDRMFVALMQGYSPQAHPEWFMEVLNEGKAMESQISAMHDERTGIPTINAQGRIEWEVMEGVFIVGSYDGQAADADILREYKKARESTWNKARRSGVEMMPHYPMQVSAYMIGGEFTGAEFVIGLYDPEKDSIIDTSVHTLHDPPVPRKGLLKRIAILEGYAEDGVHPMDVPCSTRMYPCPFFYLHDADAEEPPERPADETVRTLITEWDALGEALSQARKAVRDGEERVKALKAGVIAWLQANGQEADEPCKLVIDGVEYTVEWKHQHRDGYIVQPNDYDTATAKRSGASKPPPKPRAPRKPRTKAAVTVVDTDQEMETME